MSKINIPVDYHYTEDKINRIIRVTFEIDKKDIINSLFNYNQEVFEKGYKAGYIAAKNENM